MTDLQHFTAQAQAAALGSQGVSTEKITAVRARLGAVQCYGCAEYDDERP
ncbi:hypothetical protein NE235_33535 [Actinoallomurus spadix]|uniref:Uncharacterized protein n=1 Tax=Actinoallomurus spadix TaxID=79912 RepID=A0ABN0X8S2_9ACTN|nr:hypothetical protein [Actinoallomurus spadix]MCO5991045.1 hypothetical protein [Actinoallomurus spadix]